MNEFLNMMDITFRRDPYNFRPRINKHASVKDSEQKKAGNYFLMDEGASRTVVAGDADGDEDAEDAEERKNILAEESKQPAAGGKKKGKKGGAAAQEEAKAAPAKKPKGKLAKKAADDDWVDE